MDLFAALMLALAAIVTGASGWFAYRASTLEQRAKWRYDDLAEELRRAAKTSSADLDGQRQELRGELASTLKTARADLAQFSEQIEDMIDHARRERARADGRKGGGRPPKDLSPEEAPARVWTRETYLQHVSRTGKTDPAIEAQLGI